MVILGVKFGIDLGDVMAHWVKYVTTLDLGL